jgi:hypothetical protein
MGGPTFGVDVQGVEIVRFDSHGPRGHWHKGGYDKLGPGGSHQDFPQGMVDISEQLAWSLEQVKQQGAQLLAEAGYPDAGASIDSSMVEAFSEAIMAHLESEGDLRSKAVEQGLIAAD